MKEQWILMNKGTDFAATGAELGVPPLIVKLMFNRGIQKEQMGAFLRDDINSLADPALMKGLNEAAGILSEATGSGDRIAVVTDYDCDGIFSGMVLYTGLLRIGAVPVLFTPDRVKDGYGINRRIIDEIYNRGINYIITCDNGIAAYDEVCYAKELGMKIIVTDHHEIPFSMDGNNVVYTVPPADAVCNPKQPGCGYPYKELCGAGVAYRLIDYMYTVYGIPFEDRKLLLQYTAIATIADIMELTGENRVLVKAGLNYLNRSSCAGLEAVKKVCGLEGKMISVYHIGFVIGPCFNAAGRLKNVEPAFKLLLSGNEAEALTYANELFELNAERKEMTEQGVIKCMEMMQSDGNVADDRVVVIVLDDCHESIAGIIAGRVKDAVNKPVIVFTIVEDGMCKGSGRSIPAYDMFGELSKCKDLFERFGGHAMAAGITLKAANVDELRRRLNDNCTLTDKDMMPVVRLDAEVLFRHMSMEMVNSLHILEPYGNGNQRPLFCAAAVSVKRAMVLGRSRRILKLLLEDKDGGRIEAVYFGDYEAFINMVEEEYGTEQRDRMLRGADNNVRMAFAFYPDINEYNGMRQVQLVIQNYA